MGKISYYTVNGQIQGQHVQGDAEGKDYLLDASGNLVGVYQGDYLKADASYDPFGNILDSWNISFYNFTWAGGHGYRQTGLAFSSVYLRARHYSNLDAGWTTRDPLWPSEMPYGYVEGRVPGGVDYWGMQSILPSTGRGTPPPNPIGGSPLQRPKGDVGCSEKWNVYIFDYCNRCFHNRSVNTSPMCAVTCDQMARAYHRKCKGKPGPGNFEPPSGSPGPVAPRTSYGPECTTGYRPDGCLECGAAIWRDWRDSHIHALNHSYTHCMSCCVLSKLAGPDCAAAFQAGQIIGDRRGNIKPINNITRMAGCSIGVQVSFDEPIRNMAETQRSCHKGCVANYPHPPGSHLGSLPLPRECY